MKRKPHNTALQTDERRVGVVPYVQGNSRAARG